MTDQERDGRKQRLHYRTGMKQTLYFFRWEFESSLTRGAMKDFGNIWRLGRNPDPQSSTFLR